MLKTFCAEPFNIKNNNMVKLGFKKAFFYYSSVTNTAIMYSTYILLLSPLVSFPSWVVQHCPGGNNGRKITKPPY